LCIVTKSCVGLWKETLKKKKGFFKMKIQLDHGRKMHLQRQGKKEEGLAQEQTKE
jgi:hypothetical protein